MGSLAYLLVNLGLLFSPSRTWAQDLAVADTSFAGLSDLATIASVGGGATRVEGVVDLGQLQSHDALLMVHPGKPLPIGDLSAFLRRGGRIALAADIGPSAAFLRAFDIEHRPVGGVDDSRRLRGNRNLLIATPQIAHPLTRGVAAMLTNHPGVLRHARLSPVFALGDDQAVVLTGAVGQGRLVVVSDASVLINNMLEIAGNRRFAENLVRYLAGDDGGTLYVLGTRTAWRGTIEDHRLDHPLAAFEAGLARVAHLPLPSAAVTATSAMLALLLLGSASSTLPRRSAYAARRARDVPECRAGFTGRLVHYAQGSRNFLAPLLVFQHELEAKLATQLRLPGQQLPRDLIDALTRAGASPRTTQAAQALLMRLHALHTQAQGTTPYVSERKFRDLVASGRRILADLESVSRVHT